MGAPRKREEDRELPRVLARLYDRTDEKVIVNALLEEVLSGRRFERALDVGGGEGAHAGVLAARSEQLTLLDVRADYRDHLQARYPQAKVVIEPAETFAPDSSFDLILISHLLYYIPTDQWRPLLEHYLSLTNDGGFLLVILNSDEADWYEVYQHFHAELGRYYGFYYTPWRAFRQSLALGPLKVIPYRSTVSFDTPQELADFCARGCLSIWDQQILERYEPEFCDFAQDLCNKAGGPELEIASEIVVIGKTS